jgi:hypothetical protein
MARLRVFHSWRMQRATEATQPAIGDLIGPDPEKLKVGHAEGGTDGETSAASRPRAIIKRPIRRALFRGSNVCHVHSRYASMQAAKSLGPSTGGTPISPR